VWSENQAAERIMRLSGPQLLAAPDWGIASAESGSTASGEKLQDVPLLLPTRGYHAQHSLHEPAACRPIGPAAALAPQHRMTECSLGTIDGP
jgi:hypothetical protein